jgi:PPOX class probable F420-dependent enzyme
VPSRRDLIRMSDAELREFVRSRKTMTIVSNGPEGFPHPMPMWFVLDDDGVVRMTTFRKSQKVQNLRRDPRVALLVEDGVEYAQLRGVVLYGRCEVIDDLDAVTATLIDITGGEAANDPTARAGMAKVIQGTAAKRVLLRTRPDRIVSWDHRKLGGRY